MASPIATLRVLLTGDDAELRKKLKEADGKLSAFERREIARQKRIRQARIAAAKGAAVAAASFVAAAGAATKAAIGYGDQLAKNAAEVGLLTSEYDRLQSAAVAAGIDQSKLDVAMRTLNKSIGESSIGMGEARVAFQQLGVQIRNEDGTLKSNRQVLGEVSNALAGVEDHSLKVALSQKIMGESGGRMLKLLGQGNVALTEQEDLMRKLGATMSDETAAKAELLQTKMDILGDAIKTSLATKLIEAADRTLPYFIKFADKMVWLAQAIAIGWNATLKRFARMPLVIGKAIEAGGNVLASFEKFFRDMWNNLPLHVSLAMVKMKKGIVDGFAYVEQQLASSAIARKVFGIDGDNMYFTGLSDALAAELKSTEELLATSLTDTVLDPNWMQKLGGTMVEGTGDYIAELEAKITNLKSLMAGDGPISTGNAIIEDANKDGGKTETKSEELTRFEKIRQQILDTEKAHQESMRALQDNTNMQALKGLQGLVKGHTVAGRAILMAQKTMAVKQILMDGQKAIMKAYAEGGPIQGVVQAAMVAGQLSQALSTVNSVGVQGQFHAGIDSVPNTGTYLLEKGERVVDRRLNEDLTKALEGGNGSVGGTINMPINISGDVSPERMAEMMREVKDSVSGVLAEINSDRAGQGLF